MIRDGYEWNNSSANVSSLADAFTNSLKETINRTGCRIGLRDIGVYK
jgi:hypothetical protein